MDGVQHVNGAAPWGARVFMLVCFAVAIVFAWRNRRSVRETIVQFFSAETSPYNLALFRVIAFVCLFEAFDLEHAVLMSKMPDSLIFPPRFGWRHVIPYMPIDPQVIYVCSLGIFVFGFLGLIGLFTRFSAWMTFFLALFVIGVQMFYGKVNHWHHMVWFVGLVAASPSGAVFSVDAVRAAWRRADGGHVEALRPARAYALPIRIAWILLGIGYFFPGFWKLWDGGFRWIFSDNLKFTMWGRWFDLSVMPPFRIDAFAPGLYIGAAWTIIWELTFIVLIFWPVGRFFAAAQGIMFHSMTRVFIHIPFTALQLAYLTFVDWAKWLHVFATPFFPKPCYVLYDGGCQICRRTIATLNVFDLLGHTTYIPLQDMATRKRVGLDHLDDAALMRDMHAVIDGRAHLGFDAYRAMAPRFPVLWLALPLAYIPPIPQIGRMVYNRIAHNRACPIDGGLAKGRAVSLAPPTTSLALVALASYLIVGNVVTGAMLETQAWPVACYPTFRKIVTAPESHSIDLIMVDEDGTETPYDWQPISDAMKSPVTLLHRIGLTSNEKLRAQRWDDLLNFWRREFDADFDGVALRLYNTTRSTRPGEWDAPPLSSELVAEVSLLGDASEQ